MAHIVVLNNNLENLAKKVAEQSVFTEEKALEKLKSLQAIYPVSNIVVVVFSEQSQFIAGIFDTNFGTYSGCFLLGRSRKAVKKNALSYDLVAIQKDFEHTAQNEDIRNAPHSLLVGDVLLCSSGYENTSAKFFEVISTTKTLVKIRRLNSEIQYNKNPNDPKKDDHMSGYAVPMVGNYMDDEIISAKANGINEVKTPVGLADKAKYTELDGKRFYRKCQWNS